MSHLLLSIPYTYYRTLTVLMMNRPIVQNGNSDNMQPPGGIQNDLSPPSQPEKIVSFLVGGIAVEYDSTLDYELPNRIYNIDFPKGALSFVSLNIGEFSRVVQGNRLPLEKIKEFAGKMLEMCGPFRDGTGEDWAQVLTCPLIKSELDHEKTRQLTQAIRNSVSFLERVIKAVDSQPSEKSA
jgi:hypothetical protein